MPWAMARMMQLLSCHKSTAVLIPGSVETQTEGASGGPQEVDLDELVMVRESVRSGPFQTKIIEGQVKPLLGRHGSHYDHTTKGGRSTMGSCGACMGSQTASSGTPCPSCIYAPQEWQQ